eukprot:4404771-Amphidinium_carterae.1
MSCTECGFLAWTFIAPDLSELPLALTGGPSSPLGVLLSSVGVAGGSGLGAEVERCWSSHPLTG